MWEMSACSVHHLHEFRLNIPAFNAIATGRNRKVVFYNSKEIKKLSRTEACLNLGLNYAMDTDFYTAEHHHRQSPRNTDQGHRQTVRDVPSHRISHH
jgi:hypothetical protein